MDGYLRSFFPLPNILVVINLMHKFITRWNSKILIVVDWIRINILIIQLSCAMDKLRVQAHQNFIIVPKTKMAKKMTIRSVMRNHVYASPTNKYINYAEERQKNMWKIHLEKFYIANLTFKTKEELKIEINEKISNNKWALSLLINAYIWIGYLFSFVHFTHTWTNKKVT